MLVWQHASGTSSCKCPLCRRPITLLIPTEHSLSPRHDPEISQILFKIHITVSSVANPPLFFRECKIFLRLLREFPNPQRSLLCVAGVCCVQPRRGKNKREQERRCFKMCRDMREGKYLSNDN